MHEPHLNEVVKIICFANDNVVMNQFQGRIQTVVSLKF